MKVFHSYGQGIKEALWQPKMILTLWLINVIFGWVIFYLSYGAFSESFGKSLVADRLLKKFDFNILFEFLIHDGGFSAIFAAAFVLICVYLLVSIFLSGGILFCLYRPLEYGQRNNTVKSFAHIFFQGAGKFFGRFFRLFLYSLILWGIFTGFNLLLNPLGRMLHGDGRKEQMMFYLFWVRLAIALFLLFLIKMILDYTRIKIVTEDSPLVFRSLFRTVGFVFRRFWSTLALYYLLVATGAALYGAFWAIKSIIPSRSLLTVMAAFIVAQVFIASRGWMKIAFFAAQLKLYLFEHFKVVR